jgi:hypothetical protein
MINSKIYHPDKKCIHFTEEFKYIGSLISLKLDEVAEIANHIKMAISLMGILLSFFFNWCDVDLCTKCNMYVVSPLNALLVGCKTWNLMAKV